MFFIDNSLCLPPCSKVNTVNKIDLAKQKVKAGCYVLTGIGRLQDKLSFPLVTKDLFVSLGSCFPISPWESGPTVNLLREIKHSGQLMPFVMFC